jgi:hypothetical protein
MYTGSLVIAAFGRYTTTGTTTTTGTSYYVGIPLTGQCNTAPYHSHETLTFPTTPTGTDTFMFTIPAYGGQVNAVDTDSDTIPDIPAGCTSVSRGDPLTGSGSSTRRELPRATDTRATPAHSPCRSRR